MPSYSNFNPADYKQNTESHFYQDTFRPIGQDLGNAIQSTSDAVKSRRERRDAAKEDIQQKADVVGSLSGLSQFYDSGDQYTAPQTASAAYAGPQEAKNAKDNLVMRIANGAHNLLQGDNALLGGLTQDQKADYERAMNAGYAPLVGLVGKLNREEITADQFKGLAAAMITAHSMELANAASKMEDGPQRLYQAAQSLQASGVDATDLRSAAIDSFIQKNTQTGDNGVSAKINADDPNGLYQALIDAGFNDKDIQASNRLKRARAITTAKILADRNGPSTAEKGTIAIGSGAGIANGTSNDNKPISTGVSNAADASGNVGSRSNLQSTAAPSGVGSAAITQSIGGSSSSNATQAETGGQAQTKGDLASVYTMNKGGKSVYENGQTLGEQVSSNIQGNDLSKVYAENMASILKELDPNISDADLESNMKILKDVTEIQKDQSGKYLSAVQSSNATAMKTDAQRYLGNLRAKAQAARTGAMNYISSLRAGEDLTKALADVVEKENVNNLSQGFTEYKSKFPDGSWTDFADSQGLDDDFIRKHPEVLNPDRAQNNLDISKNIASRLGTQAGEINVLEGLHLTSGESYGQKPNYNTQPKAELKDKKTEQNNSAEDKAAKAKKKYNISY